MNAKSIQEWLDSWGDGPNWSDTTGVTVPMAKSTLSDLLHQLAAMTAARDELFRIAEDHIPAQYGSAHDRISELRKVGGQ